MHRPSTPSTDLTAPVADLVRGLGADLVGFAPVERFAGAPVGHRPEDVLPGARSVVSYAFNVLESVFITPVPRVYQWSYMTLRNHANVTSYEIARFFERAGHFAVPIPSTIPVEFREHHGLFGDFSHRHAAVMAGLGEIGLNRMLITPRFGPRVWLGTVITTAELAPAAMLDASVCLWEGCDLCMEACPVGAISRAGLDIPRCAKGGVHSLNLSGLLRHFKAILREPDPQQRERLVLGPETWDLYQGLVCGMIPACNKCALVCPIGRRLPHDKIAAGKA